MHMKKCITIHVLLGNIRPRFRYRCWGACSVPSTQMYCAMTDSHCMLCLRHNTHPRPWDKKAWLGGGGHHYSGCLPSSFTPITQLRVKTFEPPNQEIICLEITKRKWLIYSFYRSESFSDLTTFLEELKKSIDKAINKYENIILMGDINVDMSDRNNTHTNYDNVQELSDILHKSN